ncbi:MAG: LamB/YcsF family protein [Haliscomenobacter sp.]|nr:LamB/YcsF family protein [Haliscomenobacter sp.]
MHTKSLPIDLNCDMGESFGAYTVGNDGAIFPLITSCNIACGFHGGDPLHIENTIKGALAHGVRIGAHPGYPDLQGFGRRYLRLQENELQAVLRYQIAALKGMTECLGGQLAYVKPHGALYNTAAEDEREARIIAETIRDFGAGLALMGLAGSIMEAQALKANIPFIAEAFADRRYGDNGKLLPRSIPGAVIHDPEAAAEQAWSIAINKGVYSNTGAWLPIDAQSLCVHGDNPEAVERAFRALGRLGV